MSPHFEDFFASGLEESISPFLTPASRGWGKNLSLKTSLLSAVFLLCAFFLSFNPDQRSFSHICLLFTYFLAGIPALIASIEDLLSFEIDIDVMMTLSAFLSLFIGCEMEGGLLLVLFAFSGAMEEAVRSRAKSAISSLKKLSPTKALVLLDDGTMAERSVKDIGLGHRIHVRAGDIVPLDGRVLWGNSSVNLKHLTGENLPHPKQKGEDVPAGAMNLDGTLTLEVTRTSSHSTLARIVELITQAQEAKPKLEQWFDRLGRWYATIVLLLALCFACTLPLLLSIPFLGVNGSLYRALTFLIAASPCALIIAVPIAYLSAISACARQGILLKGGILFDALAKCKTLVFDKTGTLTKGELACLSVEAFEEKGSVEEAIAVAMALEQNAVHPIAQSILLHARENRIQPVLLTAFNSSSGYGVSGTLENGDEVFLGNPEFIFAKSPSKKSALLNEKIEKIQKEGELFTLLLCKESLFIFRFKDSLRPKMRETLASLKQEHGLKLLMLSGDHYASAKAIAEEAGIEEFHADLRPEDKLAQIARLSEIEETAMVGDGINDAPALARATVGISLGKMGSGSAINASDIILLQDKLELLQWLFRKAKATRRIVKQNLFLASAVIATAIFPALFGWIPLWIAVLLHEGGTVVVGLNALRLLKRNI